MVKTCQSWRNRYYYSTFVSVLPVCVSTNQANGEFYNVSTEIQIELLRTLDFYYGKNLLFQVVPLSPGELGVIPAL
jgi:hypothetical protein